jgi:peptidoglycan/LPS O-acetylase OafA/YrhL
MPLSSPQVAPRQKPARARHLVHIRELDGVRGIAAIMVFFHHVCYVTIQPAGWGPSVRFLRTLSIPGDSGVDLFFALSGFLITSLLIEAREKPAYYHDFYWKRVLRILPLYLLCLLGVLLFIPGTRGYVFLSCIFLSNFASLFHVESTGPFWTLAIEEQFYLLWPTVVRRRSVEQLRNWAMAIGFGAVLLRFMAAPFGHHNYYLTFFRCDGLAFGAFLACWFYRRGSTPNLARESRMILLGMLSAIALLGLSFLFGPAKVAFHGAFLQTGVTLLCGSIIAFCICNSGQRKLAFLRSPLLTFFGLISYAMYMIHLYVLRAYDSLRGPLSAGDNAAYALRFFVVFAITIVLCLLSRYLVELPAMSLRRFVLSRPASPTPSDPPLPLGNM